MLMFSQGQGLVLTLCNFNLECVALPSKEPLSCCLWHHLSFVRSVGNATLFSLCSKTPFKSIYDVLSHITAFPKCCVSQVEQREDNALKNQQSNHACAQRELRASQVKMKVHSDAWRQEGGEQSMKDRLHSCSRSFPRQWDRKA